MHKLANLQREALRFVPFGLLMSPADHVLPICGNSTQQAKSHCMLLNLFFVFDNEEPPQGMGQWDSPEGPGCLHTPTEQVSGKSSARSRTRDFWVYSQSKHFPLQLRHPGWGPLHASRFSFEKEHSKNKWFLLSINLFQNV